MRKQVNINDFMRSLTIDSEQQFHRDQTMKEKLSLIHYSNMHVLCLFQYFGSCMSVIVNPTYCFRLFVLS